MEIWHLPENSVGPDLQKMLAFYVNGHLLCMPFPTEVRPSGAVVPESLISEPLRYLPGTASEGVEKKLVLYKEPGGIWVSCNKLMIRIS